jgi:hypothetical protein
MLKKWEKMGENSSGSMKIKIHTYSHIFKLVVLLGGDIL